MRFAAILSTLAVVAIAAPVDIVSQETEFIPGRRLGSGVGALPALPAAAPGSLPTADGKPVGLIALRHRRLAAYRAARLAGIAAYRQSLGLPALSALPATGFGFRKVGGLAALKPASAPAAAAATTAPAS